MSKRVPGEPPSYTLPQSLIRRSSSQRFVLRHWRGKLVIASWPRKTNRKPSPDEQIARDRFKQLVKAQYGANDTDKVWARAVARGSVYTWRDILALAYTGQLIWLFGVNKVDIQQELDLLSDEIGAMIARAPDGWVGLNPPQLNQVLIGQGDPVIPIWRDIDELVPAVSDWLDTISSVPGTILVRGSTGWLGIAPGVDGQVLTMSAGEPAWLDDDVGVVEVDTGAKLVGGPITSSGTIAHATIGTAGTITNPTLVLDGYGHIMSGTSGSAGSVTAVVAGPKLTGGTITTAGTIAHDTIGTAGTISNPTIVLDGYGHVVSATAGSGGSVTNVVAGSGLSGGTITTTGTISMPNTGPGSGSYTAANISIDAQGRITAAANGSGGGGGVGGLYSAVMSTLPTSTGTGLSTWLNQNSATITDDGISGLRMGIASGHTGFAEWSLRTKTAPATPYHVKALLCNHALVGGARGHATIFGWYDGTKIQGIGLYNGTPYNNGTFVAGFTTVHSGSTQTTQYGTNQLVGDTVPMWVRIGDDGTNYTFDVSYDGGVWINIHTHAKSGGYLANYNTIIFGGCSDTDAHTVTLLSYTETP